MSYYPEVHKLLDTEVANELKFQTELAIKLGKDVKEAREKLAVKLNQQVIAKQRADELFDEMRKRADNYVILNT